MKLPRWLLICLVSVNLAALVVLPAVWWLTWPDRTARDFVTLVAQDRFEEVLRMCRTNPYARNPGVMHRIQTGFGDGQQPTLERAARTHADILAGRQNFWIPELHYGFTVQRGRIVSQSERADKVGY